ncbi:hypothetical protein [Wolbachia endosymbiont (group A) of Lasioglossum fulvicorne]
MKRAITEARGEESKIQVSATQMTDDDHTKDPVKSKNLYMISRKE